MQISLAVPVYECHGMGWLYLSELLNSVAKQTYKNIEIVISDQSTDDKIKILCDAYKNYLNIKYVTGHHLLRSNSPNANNAIKNCSSKYIKILFQDDFFVDEMALQKIVAAFESDAMWIVSGCVHCSNIHSLYRPFVPYYNDNMLEGNNTISSPSVLSVQEKELFDENLIMLMDCEMYYRLHNKYGEPYIIRDLLVCNRQHKNQLQNLNQDKLSEEIDYCKNKYKGA
jgi:glycosyltransferase involved in cell wall biosynthesis